MTMLKSQFLTTQINQSKLIQRPFKIHTQGCSRTRLSKAKQSWEGGGIEKWTWTTFVLPPSLFIIHHYEQQKQTNCILVF